MIATDPRPDPDASSHGRRSTILVVEDDRPVLEMATHILRAAGHVVVPARSAEEALELEPQLTSLHLLFTDVVMAGMDGLALAREVTARRRVAVLVTTGQRTPEVRAAIAAAELPYLPKPYTAAGLREAAGRSLQPAELDGADR